MTTPNPNPTPIAALVSVPSAGRSGSDAVPRQAPWTLRTEVEIIAELLRRRRAGTSLLEIANLAQLGTVVVIPALQLLIEEGVVQRRMVQGGGRGPRSEYLLTSAGRRQAS